DLTDLSPPTTINPYTVLSLDKTATEPQIKTAYRRLALLHHPDKAAPGTTDTAKEKFQELALAYAILSDPRRRARYDLTGRTEESLTLDGEGEDGEFNWSDFYRGQFEDVISAASIEEFKKTYQGSEEEGEAVLAAYTEGEGDLDVVFESVMVSEVEADEERFRVMIQEAIDKGEVEAYRSFTKESKKKAEGRRKRAREEAKEAEEAAEELGVKEKLFGKKGKGGGEEGLKALIMQRQKGRQEDFLAGLEAKYGGGGKKGKGKAKKGLKEVEEPPEEMFERNRKK
ncbi:DnaJ domain-containing protein, partial [Elsinoe ampelina]